MAALTVYDISYEADVERSELPRLKRVLEFVGGHIFNPERLAATPHLAKPIVTAAWKAERTLG